MKVSLHHYDLWMRSPRRVLDASLTECTVLLDDTGTPLRRLGESCVVYNVQLPDRGATALRMFFNVDAAPPAGECTFNEHGQAVERYLKSLTLSNSPWVPYQYLSEGLLLPDGRHRVPVIMMPWVEGDALGQWLKGRAANHDTTALKKSLDRWLQLLASLDKADLGHGQLDPRHVLVETDGALRLIDYDVMCVPELLGRPSPRLRPAVLLQHPQPADPPLLMPQNDTYPGIYLAAFIGLLAADPEAATCDLTMQSKDEKPAATELIVAGPECGRYALAPFCRPWLSRGDAVLSNLLECLLDLANQPFSSLPRLMTVLKQLEDRKKPPPQPSAVTVTPKPQPAEVRSSPKRPPPLVIPPPPPPHKIRIKPPPPPHKPRSSPVDKPQVVDTEHTPPVSIDKEVPEDEFTFTLDGGLKPRSSPRSRIAKPGSIPAEVSGRQAREAHVSPPASEANGSTRGAPASVVEPPRRPASVVETVVQEAVAHQPTSDLAAMRALARHDRAAFLKEFDAAKVREAHSQLSPEERRELAQAVRNWLSDPVAVGLREQMPCGLQFPEEDRLLARWNWPKAEFADRVVLGICREPPTAGQRPEDCGLVFSSIVVRNNAINQMEPYSIEIKPEYRGCHVAVWAVVDVGFPDETTGAHYFASGPLELGTVPGSCNGTENGQRSRGLWSSIRNRLIK